ncbi:hypothetical protein AMV031 [Betaentomopoxvirus amoorei]|uniref:AMV031 n=1 Tax=Amsacta moorei entomopoxvirus TaxID=28321 RepID=Q9EN17_AMEPV|nr:hypothetical protein AMV031 [Amsacta moorei entomopoxvirus]AAG02737.1 AMV031 [Amsacta moorei entomopoxvirus]
MHIFRSNKHIKMYYLLSPSKIKEICTILAIFNIIINIILISIDLVSLSNENHLCASKLIIIVIDNVILLLSIFINLILLCGIYLDNKIIIKTFILIYIPCVTLYMILTFIKIYTYSMVYFEMIYIIIKIIINFIYIMLIKIYYDNLNLLHD